MQFEYFNARLLQNTALKIKQTVGAVTPPAGYAFGVLSALTNLEITNSDLVENVNSVYVNTLDIKIPTEETMVEYVEYVFEHDAAKRDSVIIKSNTIPAASAELLGYEYQYMGETNNTYTHGFVYVCKGIPADTLVFTPNTVSCDWANLSAFLQTETADYNSVVAGSMTYFADAELWRATFTDANGDTVLTYQQYTGDWEDVGFVFSQTFEDGDVVSFVRHTEFDYVWERVDLQPNHEQDIVELQTNVAEIQSVIPAQASASNQLADKNYVQSGLDGKQDTLTATDGINLNNNVISGKPLQDDIADINALIPGQASTSNQLADKNFVNSSIATNTANFIGTFNSVAELEAYSGTLTNNDYAFVVKTDSAGNTYYDRYKYTTATTPAGWIFEYELNNSSFTASQWAAINSGATSSNIAQIDTNKTNIANHIADTNNPHNVTKAQVGLGNVDNTSDLNKPISTATQTALNGKQATISDLATIRSNAQAGKAASDTIATYGNIVTHNISEFATATQGAKADTAVQPSDLGNGTITITQGGIPKGTFTTNQGSDATIALDAGGGGIGNIDNLTITANADDEIQTVATINANTATGATNPIYDWVGTLAEYNAQSIESLHPDWVCFITDDLSAEAYEAYTKGESLNLFVQKGHQVIEFQEPTAANNYTWYRKYADGWVEQGGKYSWSNNGKIGPINLIVPMLDGNYQVMTNVVATASDGNDTVNIDTRNTTNFYINAYSSYRNIVWQVSGMAA